MKIHASALLSFFLAIALSSTANAKSYGSRICANDDRFTCYTVKAGESWQTLFPQADKRDLVMRINRINIQLERGMRIAIPKDIDDADMLNYAPFSRQISSPGEKIIVVSLHENQLAFGAYDAEGYLKYWGPVSGGRSYCPDLGRGCHTAVGKYSIYRKGGASCKSTKFPIGRGGAPMPYCMYFHAGFALHGSHEVPGYNASHGCVRMFVNDAQWLNENFTRDEDSVPVIVKSSQI
ncbi:MAG: hypothetical protein K0S27_1364 [Gammaproteobacteria bacterium]|jgi:hypothetical protein|nr:hypothetical protein [Gammaproteobacteria bacterium]